MTPAFSIAHLNAIAEEPIVAGIADRGIRTSVVDLVALVERAEIAVIAIGRRTGAASDQQVANLTAIAE